ncbi:winged helix DNA-binding domain-containing protein [Kitasatospora sp. NBC_01250]|uniref:winged helix DNA-binding domain-containing protein n=1 Tax=unclassified Kitasatospora TaxID=2633591 RepID=UPI002E134E65|nr:MULTISPECIES: winged helix DNA-binding domain-containing protein [unclassified Kitasatospora]WSJ65792.1 winged helix DNA-binding domain-containing protein [Kitasatospora sp. NBC_01302]
MPEVLDRRALNRALLARQHLLAPAAMTPQQLIGHLVGLQAQAVDPPFYGLWSRLADFTPVQLGELLERRAVVRLGLQRGTIHLVTAEDCLTLRPLLQGVLDQGLRGAFGRRLAGLDLAALTERGRRLVEERPRTFQELGALLGPEYPEHDPAALAQVLRARLALVQVPPRGLWRNSGAAAHTTAEQWLGRPLAEPADPADLAARREELVLRYLAAFGPASVADLQKWSGLTRLSAEVRRLRPRLAEFRDEAGRPLHDLPEAPRPAGGTPAPVRLLAPFDNLLLSHADRTRVLPEAHRPRVMTQNGIVLGTLLVDGFVAGIWELVRPTARAEEATVAVRPFAPLDRAARTAAEQEARRLLAFAEPQVSRARVRFDAP